MPSRFRVVYAEASTCRRHLIWQGSDSSLDRLLECRLCGNLDDFISPDYVGHLGATTMDRHQLERLERQFSVAFRMRITPV